MFFGLCTEECHGRNWQLNLQFGVAGVIVLVALSMIGCAILESWRALLVLTGLSLLLYLGWVLLLLDAGQVTSR